MNPSLESTATGPQSEHTGTRRIRIAGGRRSRPRTTCGRPYTAPGTEVRTWLARSLQ